MHYPSLNAQSSLHSHQFQKQLSSDIFCHGPALTVVVTIGCQHLLNKNHKLSKTFRDSLNSAFVTPIYKEKGSQCNPADYRPIYSLPIIPKVFEKILHKQLSSHFSKHSLVSDRQSGNIIQLNRCCRPSCINETHF